MGLGPVWGTLLQCASQVGSVLVWESLDNANDPCSRQQSHNSTIPVCLYLGLSKPQRNNVELCSLSELLQSVILHDRAPSTVTTYARVVNRWIVWCKRNAFTPPLAKPIAVALYLVKLMDRNLSKSSIFNTVYGFNLFHRKFSVKNPIQSSLVSQTVASLRRLMARPCIKRNPLRSRYVRELIHARLHSLSSGGAT